MESRAEVEGLLSKLATAVDDLPIEDLIVIGDIVQLVAELLTSASGLHEDLSIAWEGDQLFKGTVSDLVFHFLEVFLDLLEHLDVGFTEKDHEELTCLQFFTSGDCLQEPCVVLLSLLNLIT